ncbi:MAG: tRNA preQ1(34) S-adenosylmethionine ribosyltransferase-isomerase QueA [Acidobacteria bacterium]|nr:tRNA preQ1(34) S-adenosylmethionine ribosyltransferase-isomerase QueA [Acidobacteriota bacterium]
MLIEEFDFELPPELIAQQPLDERSASRMLAIDRGSVSVRDSFFCDFPKFLRSGDTLVLNNTKVFPARLFGRTETGANVELFMIREVAPFVWEALARPAKRLKPGRRIVFDDHFSASVVERLDDGRVLIEFAVEGDFDEALNRVGRTPLPPYIKREGEQTGERERYQTVFAKQKGAIAAPTAGLHFTPDVLAQIESGGVSIAEITLHVGYGTFEPVRVSDLSAHRVSGERFEIDERTAETLNRVKSGIGRIIAVGTTVTRTLEHALATGDRFRAERGIADTTITPGYRFRAIDGLLTNFHLPKSSLLVLVSAFAGHELIMNAYRHAVGEKYRFYSYGDCTFIF